MSERGVRKKLIGVVVVHKMDKTAIVSVSRLKKHKAYMKYLTVQKRYMVHDPHNRCRVGDKVRIIESRPISKIKKWVILDILEETSERGDEIEGEEAVRA